MLHYVISYEGFHNLTYDASQTDRSIICYITFFTFLVYYSYYCCFPFFRKLTCSQ